MSVWEAELNDESDPWSVVLAAADNDEPNVEHENRRMECCCTDDEDVNAREVKSTVKELAANLLSKMIEKPLDHILCKPFHNARSSIQRMLNKTLST